VVYSVNGTQGTTNSTLTLGQGTYVVQVPQSVTSGDITYVFVSWEDSSTNSTRILELIEDTTMTATYVNVEQPAPEAGGGFVGCRVD
jgi:hypothetical protein